MARTKNFTAHRSLARKTVQTPKKLSAPKAPVKKRLTPAQRETIKLQKSIKPIFPPSRFKVLIKELLQVFMTDLHLAKDGARALQAAAEDFLGKMFTKLDKLAAASGRKTIKVQDLKLWKELFGPEEQP